MLSDRKMLAAWAALLLVLSGCAGSAPEPTSIPSPTATVAPSATATETPTDTSTPTETSSPTPSNTPLPSDTPTPEALTATSLGNANCRLGPNEAYFAPILFLEGESAVVEGRDYNGNWVWLQPPDRSLHCWVYIEIVELNGDISEADFIVTSLPTTDEVPRPTGVSAVRNGNSVTISWNPIPDAPEVSYLIEAAVCANGFLVDVVFYTENTSITLNDATNCEGNSRGRLYGRNKLGYASPVSIPWP